MKAIETTLNKSLKLAFIFALFSLLSSISTPSYSQETSDEKVELLPDTSLPGENNSDKEKSLPPAIKKSNNSDQESPGIDGSIFGKRRRNIHPYMSVAEIYSDNIYNKKSGKESDLITRFTPGIWASFPYIKNRAKSIRTSTISPGGVIVNRFTDYGNRRRYLAYLNYELERERFSSNPSENTTSQTFNAAFKYRVNNEVKFSLTNQQVNSHDERGTGDSGELDEYNTNLLSFNLSYDKGSRFGYALNLTRFSVDYDSSTNDFRKRDDNTLSGTVYRRVWPKTRVFLQYDIIDVNYEKNDPLDNRENNLYAGVTWKISSKSTGRAKAGYGSKSFDDSSTSDGNTLLLAADLTYKINSKRRLGLEISRRTNETSTSTTDYIRTNSLRAIINQKMTGRINGLLDISYTNDLYKGDGTVAGNQSERSDDWYMLTISLQYEISRFFDASTGYTRLERLSNYSEYDFSSNTIFIKLSGTL